MSGAAGVVRSRAAATTTRVLSLLLIFLIGGCADEPADPVSLSFWQRSLENYVWDQGNGDPNILRDMSWDDIHKGFAVISDPLPQRSTDAVGLLVAHRRIDGRPYFLFLVGLVKNEVLIDLRPVALNVDRGHFHWMVGAPDVQAMMRYQHSQRCEEPSNAGADGKSHFPGKDDVFEATCMPGEIRITHRASGASWVLRW